MRCGTKLLVKYFCVHWDGKSWDHKNEKSAWKILSETVVKVAIQTENTARESSLALQAQSRCLCLVTILCLGHLALEQDWTSPYSPVMARMSVS